MILSNRYYSLAIDGARALLHPSPAAMFASSQSLLFPLWVQKIKVPSLDFQRDKVDYYMKSLSCLFGNPKKALWFFGRRVDKELCDDGNTKSNDGWSSSIAPLLARE